VTLSGTFTRFAVSERGASLEPRPGDVVVVEAACRGDRAAFGELYNRFGRMVHGILLARVPPAEAEDLLQDVFMTAYARIETLRDARAFPGWLAGIARNRATDYFRSPRSRVETVTDFKREPAVPHQDNGAYILDAIRALPEAYRETLVLRLVEGMTGPEIAGRTGLTHDSVRVNLFRGMKLLRERLGGAPKP
jgi:RNA polymerase sigma-70 factor (ECF subfamily)